MRFLLIAIAASIVQVGTGQKNTVAIDSLRDLSKYVGQYPCLNGLLDAPLFRAALRRVLEDDYLPYTKHLSQSGCGAIETRGSFVTLDVSQLHVGGYHSLIFVQLESGDTYLFWLMSSVSEGKFKVYGRAPVPTDVSEGIVDNLNSVWGHVANFSWTDGTLRIDLKNDSR